MISIIMNIFGIASAAGWFIITGINGPTADDFFKLAVILSIYSIYYRLSE